MSDSLRMAIFLIALLLLAGWAGSSDFEDAKREEQHYCSMVKDGHWPAYKDGVDCKEVK